MEADHDGEYVVIDVDSGNWAIAASELASSDSLQGQRSDALKRLAASRRLQGGGQHRGGSLRKAE